MSTAHEYQEMHHLIDRLSPEQVRHLREVVDADPDLSRDGEVAEEPGGGAVRRPRLLALIGSMDSGRSDLSERHEEIIRDEF